MTVPARAGVVVDDAADARSLRRAGELNLAGHSAHLHGDVPGARVVRIGDFQIADSGLRHDTFNIVSRVAFDRGFTADDVAAVADYVRGTGRPFSWWVADEAALAEAGPALAAVGFHPGEEEDAMVLALAEVTTPPVSANAEVKLIETSGELAQYGAILAANWDPPAVDVQSFLTIAGSERRRTAHARSRFYLACVDGMPAAGAEVYVGAGVAGIYGVATLEDYRGRGLGTQLMAAALADLKSTGLSWAVLQATEDGSSIYRRFGFRSVGICTEFAFTG